MGVSTMNLFAPININIILQVRVPPHPTLNGRNESKKATWLAHPRASTPPLWTQMNLKYVECAKLLAAVSAGAGAVKTRASIGLCCRASRAEAPSTTLHEWYRSKPQVCQPGRRACCSADLAAPASAGRHRICWQSCCRHLLGECATIARSCTCLLLVCTCGESQMV